ncbi:hypothetical protein C8N47_111100 [Mangrovibacterium marinum]|uniref:Uncharacterized protein n=1 Tax=Mangrovibacterium marinum TaxID=1639118 RepID=A0A2T5C0H1_9BACT|nr:hypothetical protein [Mangrovibacterium marinum]PTN08060.1 hypothetical protein C8N47_111100 [Mangrovibacterium marinum]
MDTKHRKLMTLLTKLGMDKDQRHELIYSWTGGRTSSSKELYSDEMANLIWKLENDFNFKTNLNPLMEVERRNKRSQVLAIAQRCGIHEGTSFEKFNSFMLNRSILKKELHKYSLLELDDLIKQFRGLEQNYRSSASHAGTKAYNRERGFNDLSSN